MATDYTAEVLEVRVIPSQDTFTNIVKKVNWTIRFYDTDHEDDVWSDAHISSVLDTNYLDPSSFIDWDNITQQQILQLAMDHEGGADFLEGLLSGGHSNLLANKKENLLDLELKDVQLLPLS